MPRILALLMLAGCGRAGFDSLGDAGADVGADAFVCTNPVGHDEDFDGIDDACDVCPQVAAIDGQADSDGDGVGDACDLHGSARDMRDVFDPFLTQDPGWGTPGGGASFQPDQVVFAGVNDSVGLTRDGVPLGTYEIGGSITQVGSTPGRARQLAIEAHVVGGTGSYYCEVYNDPTAGITSFKLTYTEDDISHTALDQMDIAADLTPDDFRLQFDDQNRAVTCIFDYGLAHYEIHGLVVSGLDFRELRIAFNDLDASVRYYLHLTQ